MFPHPVRAQPRQFDQQPFQSSFSSLPNSPHAITPQKLPQYGVDNRTDRTLPPFPQQYAQPLQRNNSYPSHGSQTGTNADQPNGSEHMLRRKTPNGTLAAGYDGTPVEWASEPHAIKHIILPASRSGGISTLQPSYSKEHGQKIALRQHLVVPDLHDLSGSRPSGVPYYRDGGPLGYQGYSQGGNWALAQHCPQGIDSMLNQGPFQQAHMYFLSNGQPVPAVLQPTYQPCLGPTASNDTGPFGPYWPNGAFVPYRPAALRDPRYLSQYEGPTWCTVGGYCQIPAQSQGWPRSFGGSLNANTGTDGNSQYPPNLTKSPSVGGPASRVNANHFFPQSTYTDYTFANQAGPSMIKIPQVRCSTSDNYLCPSLACDDVSQLPQNCYSQFNSQNGWHTSQLEQAPSSVDDLGSYNGQFREKVSSWAHSVYIDLLASLHQSQKNTPRSANGQHSNPRLNIYPRPPRQPRSHFTTSHNNQSHPLTHQASHRPIQEEHPSKRLKHHKDHTNASLNGQASQHARNPWAPNGLHFHDSDYKNCTAPQRQQHEPPRDMARESTKQVSSNDCHRDRTLRRTSAARILPIIPHNQQGTSQRTNALTALEMLTNLCDESAWKWIDGMLLGGCLAYGLGDYNKALRWYSKILSIDSKYVDSPQ